MQRYDKREEITSALRTTSEADTQTDTVTQRNRAETLRDHHTDGGAGPLVLPTSWDGSSTIIYEAAGFPAVGTSSAGIAAALGIPASERASRTEMLCVVERIAHSVALPVSADTEAGYGDTPDAVAETTRETTDAGGDWAFVPGVTDPAPIETLVDGVDGPLNVLGGPGAPPIPELGALGVARVSVDSGPMRAALGLLREIGDELHSEGTYGGMRNATPYEDLAEPLSTTEAR